MESISDDDSDISESEIECYKEKPYEEMKSGTLKVMNQNATLRCPFCTGKKKQDYRYKELYQHAYGVGASSRSGRRAKQKAEHLALAQFLEDYIAATQTDSTPANGKVKPEPDTTVPSGLIDDLFVWPWTGIIANLSRETFGENACSLEKELSKYKPLEIHTLWNEEAHNTSGYAIIDFSKEWTGYNDARGFEIDFEANKRGKRHWEEQKAQPGPTIYGWLARADDYDSECLLGEYLRKNGNLKTISDIAQQTTQEKQSKVTILTDEIDDKNENLSEWETKYHMTSIYLCRVAEEKDFLQLKYNEEMKRLQREAREHTRKIIYENEKLKDDLEYQQRELERRSKELDKQEALTELQRINLDKEREKNVSRNNSLQMASMEQRKADENVLKLVEVHKREKEAALKKLMDLQKELNDKQKLELEIAELNGQLKVLKHMGDDTGVQQKMGELENELNEKIEEMSEVEALNGTLIQKERKSNDELQEARKELTEGLTALLRTNGPTLIGIKRMGEIDSKPFVSACMQIYPHDVDGKAAELCSLWQENIMDSKWHPFQVVQPGADKFERVLDEKDEKLKGLKAEFGDGVYDAVVKALAEINENSASGRYITSELWNFKEDRKATLKEVISYILKQVKTKKRKRV